MMTVLRDAELCKILQDNKNAVLINNLSKLRLTGERVITVLRDAKLCQVLQDDKDAVLTNNLSTIGTD